MSFFDGLLVFGIITFLILIVWSRVMNQTMLETFLEIKAMVLSVFGGDKG